MLVNEAAFVITVTTVEVRICPASATDNIRAAETSLDIDEATKLALWVSWPRGKSVSVPK
jgi:hypothetical protein